MSHSEFKMLELTNISKSFTSGSAQPVPALDHFNLKLEKEDFLVVIGPNGSGKSTLLNIIAGNLMPDSGKILIDRKDFTRKQDYQRSGQISRIFQNPLSGTSSELSILDNFRLAAIRSRSKGLKIGTGTQFRNKVKDHLSILGLGLEEKIHSPAAALSGGQRQAITLLMATMDRSKILLMDEPAAALDPKTSEQVMGLADQLIKEFRLVAILITHNLRHACSFGNRLIRMEAGKIVSEYDQNAKKQLSINELQEGFV